MKVLYHANCNDGSASALGAWLALGDEGVEYIPVQYGYPPPGDLGGESIIMVDFSYKRKVLDELAGIAKNIIIIDHHKSAKDELQDIGAAQSNVVAIFDMDKSGAVLTWEHFNPGMPVPKLFYYVQDRDLWRFELGSYTNYVAKALAAKPNWRDWYGYLEDAAINEVVAEGYAIDKYLQVQIEKIIQTEPVFSGVFGVTLPIYNIHGFMISDTLSAALERYKDAPFAASYFDLEGEQKRVYSLRSRKGETDVALIAQQYGGGGHASASGFSIDFDKLGRF